MTPMLPLAVGVVLLGLAWTGAPAHIVGHGFAAHMTGHMLVVGLAAPCFALGLARAAAAVTARLPLLFAPLIASLIDLATVWGWHAPAAHAAARAGGAALVAEQGSFLAAGLLVWLSALAAGPDDGPARAAGGVFALLFTSMHMTLLGGLILLAPRPLYSHVMTLADQAAGGAIMLGVGGAVYLAGGVALTAQLLRARPA